MLNVLFFGRSLIKVNSTFYRKNEPSHPFDLHSGRNLQRFRILVFFLQRYSEFPSFSQPYRTASLLLSLSTVTLTEFHFEKKFSDLFHLVFWICFNFGFLKDICGVVLKDSCLQTMERFVSVFAIIDRCISDFDFRFCYIFTSVGIPKRDAR